MVENIKSSLYLVLGVLLGAASVVALSQVVVLVVNDILAGALTGAPETGWGFLIVMYLYLPVTLATGFVAYWFAKGYKRITHRSFAQIIVPAVILGALGIFLLYKYWG